jgi:hypothetical protein
MKVEMMERPLMLKRVMESDKKTNMLKMLKTFLVKN